MIDPIIETHKTFGINQIPSRINNNKLLQKRDKGTIVNMNTKYTATEVVKDMYNTYPEVAFIDEHYTNDDRTVDLIFDIYIN